METKFQIVLQNNVKILCRFGSPQFGDLNNFDFDMVTFYI